MIDIKVVRISRLTSYNIVVPIDADGPINADKPQEVTRNDGETPNDHHSTEAESVAMNNLETNQI